MEVSGQLHAPAASPPRKIPWYPLDRGQRGPQTRFGCGDEQKNCQALPVLEPRIIHPVAQRYTTMTPRQYILCTLGNVEDMSVCRNIILTAEWRKLHNCES